MASKKHKEKVTERAEETADEALANLSKAQYNDHFETHQSILQAKNSELTRLTEMLKNVREMKEPLGKVKATLQAEIVDANKAINAKSEEVTLIKQKLRYHSERQINENIERLEYQLRNNNFKPREEQKILDEISMLQRSKKTLREYEVKQAENKKYRTERARLIDERNTNYSKIRALYAQEEEIKKAMSEIREVIGDNKKSLDQLRQLKPTLEKNWLQEQPKQVVRSKRFEEKRKQRPEQLRIREHQETRRKSWGKYEVSKDPYEEECDVCRVLISYLQSSMNLATPTSRISSPLDCRLTPSENPSTPASDPDYMGSFYMKPKDDDGFIRVSKKEKARTKRELRLARRVKELSHTPDVLLKFSKVSVAPPRNTDEIPAAVIALQDALQHFNNLYMQAKKTTAREQNVRAIAGNIRYSRPSTLALSPPQLIVTEDASALPIGTPAFLQIETPVTSKCEQKIENPSLREKVDLGNPTSPCMDLGNPISPHVDLGNPASPRMDLGNPALPRNPSLENPSQPTMLGSEVDELFTHQHCTQLAQNASVSKPAKTWATAVAINKCTNPEATTLAVVVVKKEGGGDIVLRNGFHSTEAVNEVPVFNVKPFSNADLKNCKGKLSLSSDNSFFTSPVSLTTNLVEVNNNNNTVSPSYASVTAKLSAATVQES